MLLVDVKTTLRFVLFFRFFCGGGKVGRYIPPAWLQHTEVGDWASEVEKLWPDLISKDLQELEILFVEQCRDRCVYLKYCLSKSLLR